MPTTLIEAIQNQAARDPERQAFVFLLDGKPNSQVTYGKLQADVWRCAQALRAAGIGENDLILLVFEHSYDLVILFLGAIWAGAIPSILPYVSLASDLESYRRRVERLALASEAAAVVTLPDVCAPLSDLLDGAGCRVLNVQELLSSAPTVDAALPSCHADPEGTAFIQFTSGTTDRPKGVVLTHRAVTSNIQNISQRLQFTSQDTGVSWLPLYHDMGLITAMLLPLSVGARSVLFSAFHWIRRPSLLMQAIHEYRGTMSWMPNFAFRYCVRRIPDRDLDDLDLSSLRILGCGSEPVQHAALEAFAERFSAHGFCREALVVGYGMAENVVGISLSAPGAGLHTDWVSPRVLHREGKAVPAPLYGADVQSVVSCGSPLGGVQVTVMDEAGTLLPDRRVGEIMLRGDSLFSGYYRRPDLTDEGFRDGWFRTGDLGYTVDGQIYVCDRKKDLIIAGGRNVYPQHIEDTARSVLGDQVGPLAAFGIVDPELGTEVAILVAERRRIDEETVTGLVRQVRQRVLAELDVNLADVRLVKVGWVARTTSGKISRSECRHRYVGEGYTWDRAPQSLEATAENVDDLLQELTAIFCQVLGVHRVAPDDNFFKLGGDSLSGLRLILHIEERFGQQVPAQELLQEPTVEHIAQALMCPCGSTRIETEDRERDAERHMAALHWRRKLEQKRGYHTLFRILGTLVPYGVIAKVSAWWYGQRWVRQLLLADHVRLVREFYALIDSPVPTEAETIHVHLAWQSNRTWRQRALVRLSPPEQERWISVAGVQNVHRSLEKGRGVILVGSHGPIGGLWDVVLERIGLADAFPIMPARAYSRTTLHGRDLRRTKSGAQGSTGVLVGEIHRARRILAEGGVVTMMGDGRAGSSRPLSYLLHNRVCSIRPGFAVLALESGADVVPMTVSGDARGHARVSIAPPLDRGNRGLSYGDRIELLVVQYVDVLRQHWAQYPGSVPARRMKMHLDSPLG